jgi:dienelactone hydrolase
MRLRFPLLLLAAVSIAFPFAVSAGELIPGKMTAGSAEVSSDTGGKTEMAFYTALPEGPAPSDGWPLMVFLHGSGERGTDLDDVRRNGPPKLFGKMKELNSFMIITPQCPDGRWWDSVAVKDLIDQTVATQPVDKSRIYVTGISMGGFGVWDLLKAYPDFFAAAMPMCGGGDPHSAKRFKDVPIWIFHGSLDTDVPIQRSLEMEAALRKAGGNPTFTLYPDSGHDCWTRSYNDPEIYAWLLQQRRTREESAGSDRERDHQERTERGDGRERDKNKDRDRDDEKDGDGGQKTEHPSERHSGQRPDTDDEPDTGRGRNRKRDPGE